MQSLNRNGNFRRKEGSQKFVQSKSNNKEQKKQTSWMFISRKRMSGIIKQLFGLGQIHYEKYWACGKNIGLGFASSNIFPARPIFCIVDSTSSNNCLIRPFIPPRFIFSERHWLKRVTWGLNISRILPQTQHKVNKAIMKSCHCSEDANKWLTSMPSNYKLIFL